MPLLLDDGQNAILPKMIISPYDEIPIGARGAQAIYYNGQREDESNLFDVLSLAENWLSADCGPTNYWCDGADWNTNGTVDLTDFAALARKWHYKRFSGGVGTENDPYQIATVADWMMLIEVQTESDITWRREYLLRTGTPLLYPSTAQPHYVLTADIDFEGMQISPVGFGELQDGYIVGSGFGGVLDGQNHVLSNLVIEEPGNDLIGLFSWLRNGHIRNVGVKNATVSGASMVGGWAGYANTGSTIQQSYYVGFTSGTKQIGGLVGQNRGTVTSCYSRGQVYGTESIGGVAGLNAFGSVVNSYSSCEVEGTVWDIGGLVGYNYDAKIIRSYSTGKVTGPSYVGGLVGWRVTGPTYQDTGNLWDTETSEMETSWMGLGKITSQMQDIATFQAAGWNLETVWQMPANDYPRLKWESLEP